MVESVFEVCYCDVFVDYEVFELCEDWEMCGVEFVGVVDVVGV